MKRSRSRGAIGLTFSVVAVEDRLKDFDAWDTDPIDNLNSSLAKSPTIKGLGSRAELVIKRGDIIKVLGACDSDGSKRRAVTRSAQRLSSGFLDPDAPVHDPYDVQTWWVGTIVKRGKDLQTGRFPQRCVALMKELREKNQTFRCKMCSRMQKSYVSHQILNDFGITGQKNHLFGARDLCDSCGPKIVRVVKSVAQAVLAKESNTEIITMLKQVARRKLVHEVAIEAYALTPERVPQAPPARRPENVVVVASPRVRRNKTPPGNGSSGSRRRISKNTVESPSLDVNNNPGPATDETDTNDTNDTNSNNNDNADTTDINDNNSNNDNNNDQATDEKKMEKANEPTDVEQDPCTNGRLGNRSTLLPGLSLIFNNTCAKEGHVEKSHILRMVKRLAKDHTEAKDFICDDETAEVIIDSLDADGNGTVEFAEWSQWIVRGAARTQDERDRFKQQNDVLYNTMMFLETIARIAAKLTLNPSLENIRPALVTIFHDAMTYEGHLTPEDIQNMVESLSSKFPTIAFMECNDQVAATIVQSLDDDDNGTVELEEFVPWLMSGMSKDTETRTKFAEQGETFQLLISFMESLAQVAEQMTANILKLKPGLQYLFKKYSSGSNNSTMIVDDIKLMVNELATEYIQLEWFDCDDEFTTLIVNSLDQDGDGMVDENEFVDWMLKGAAKSSYIKEKFASKNEKFNKLSKFVTAISNVAKILNGDNGDNDGNDGNGNNDGNDGNGNNDGNDGNDGNATEPSAASQPEKATSNDATAITTATAATAGTAAVPMLLQQRRDRIKKSNVLKNLPAFGSLTEDHIKSIVDTMKYEEFDDDNPLIIEQGKVANKVYIVLAGQVSIMAASGKQGWPAEKMRIGELEVFGVEALLGIENQRYSISGVACDEVQLMSLTVPGNPILGDQAEEIVKAARKQREVDVGLKFGRKFRSKFLERKNSGTLQRVENVNGSGGGGSGDSGSSGSSGGSDGNAPSSPTTATPMPIPKEAVTGGGEDEEAALKKLKEKKKAERIAKHTAMIEKKRMESSVDPDEWGVND